MTPKRRIAAMMATVAALWIAACHREAAPPPDCTPTVVVPGAATARFPIGVYAYFTFPEVTDDTGSYPLSSLTNDFETVLSNPAIAGLSIEVGWNQLNPNPPGHPTAGVVDYCVTTSPPAPGETYDWRIYDAALCQVHTWNAAHPGDLPKTLEVMVAPGFNTPAWALAQLPGSCDALFVPGAAVPPHCGQATFVNSEGLNRPALQPLPLPWDPTYQAIWRAFLVDFNARYGTDPSLVAVGIAGPTARTYEIILPLAIIPAGTLRSDGTLPPYSLPRSQTDMWATLLQSPSSNASGIAGAGAPDDQPFVDAWSAAIDTYDSVFHGITLILSTGDQLPDFAGGPFAAASGELDFSPDCAASAGNMDCAAETQIEAHLASLRTHSDNLVASMTSGMSRSRWNSYLGLAGAKFLASAYPGKVLGGAELNTEFSRRPVEEGCQAPIPPAPGDVYDSAACTPEMLAECTSDNCDLAAACIPAACVVGTIPVAQLDAGMYQLTPEPPGGETQYVLSPEQSLYNVLQDYFNGTPAAPYYGSPSYSDGDYHESCGTAPMNYLLVYYEDIEYAMFGADAGPELATVVLADGGTTITTAQNELEVASQQIGHIANPVFASPVTP